MKFSRTIFVLLAVAATALSFAQAWSDAYEAGVKNVKDGLWAEARADFLRAVALRANDQSSPTRLPGPATEQRVWRNGSPYSANFAAAYCGFKAASAMQNDATRTALLRQVASEWETLITKEQHSRETYYYLAQAYASLREVGKQRNLEDKFSTNQDKLTWKIDPDLLTPEDRAAIAQLGGGPTGATEAGAQTAAGNNQGTVVAPTALRMDKYALLIGNSEGRLDNLKVPFAASDALLLREKLVSFCGYREDNIDIVQNATASQMRASAQALAERVEVGATVFIYFSGAGVNLDGKDYMTGIDSSVLTESSTMLAKSDLYKLFMAKGCKIFAFFQANRPTVAGRYFGMETPMVGAIAQTQATLPNQNVNGIVRAGGQVGLFTDAIAGVMSEFRSNQVPIMEFGWRVFNWMRGGRGGESGAGSVQTMTLPVIVNMKEDERF